MDELIQDLRSYSADGTIHLGGRPGLPPPTGLADALEPISRTEANLLVTGEAFKPPASRAPWVVGVPLRRIVLVVVGGLGGAYALGVFERRSRNATVGGRA